VAITRPKLGSSTKPESTHPRNLRSNNKAFNEAVNNLPAELKKELKKDRTLMNRFKEMWNSMGFTSAAAKSKSSVKDVAPLGKGGKGGTRRIKSGDTLSAIARRNNTTVAALMKLNPKIKDKDKIKAGDTINVGNPKTEAFRIKEKKRSGTTDPARTIAEAKRRGLTTYTPKGSNTPKAAVTAAELKKSGLSLRAYLNKMKKKKK
jgi:LysM repeat protein